MRTARPPPLQNPSRSAHGRLRIHRGLVQSSSPPFRPRLSFTDQLRKDPANRKPNRKPNTVHRNGVALHYLFEPDFARVGEGHDKGGVESRGKAIRLQHLTPIPRGESLAAVSQALLLDLERAFSMRRNRDGQRASELWVEERARLLHLPAAPCAVSRMTPVEVSSQALVKVEGACYSAPSRWARLQATAYIGVDQIRVVCMNESVTHPRVRPGGRKVFYRDYLPELARDPNAGRQVAPELVAELGEPWGGVWRLLSSAHGEREAARVLARLLGAVCQHGEDKVARALAAVLNEPRRAAQSRR